MRTPVAEPSVRDESCEEVDATLRTLEREIDETKANIGETLHKGRFAAEHLLRHGRYAAEDRLSELTKKIRLHPITYLGVAFVTGTAIGLLLSQTANRPSALSE